MADEEGDRYLVLVQFAYKHLDFLIPELQSVLQLYGIHLNSPDCRVLPLPNEKERHEYPRPFIILSFPQERRIFRAKSDEADDSAFQTEISHGARIDDILFRCTLVHCVVELWGSGCDVDPCSSSVREWISKSNMGRSVFQSTSAQSQTWKVTIQTLGAKFSREEQEEMRKKFSHLEFLGNVRMSDPDNEYILIREVEMDAHGNPIYPKYNDQKVLIPENATRPPLAVYFGRVLGGVRRGRKALQKFSLKKRSYLGPTSMDAELSFVMANFGLVRKGSVVLDPFVGTGSILLSCALLGAYCVGTDIDIRVLRGRSDNENIFTNFDQFNLQRPELLRSDNALYSRHFRTHRPIYDAIICDPPYGIRAGARKSGSRFDDPRPVLEEHRHDHIAQTKPYEVSDVMADLLDMAAQNLIMGGRLVYVIPSYQDFDANTDLPRHPCLDLDHSCYQPFSLELGRRIVCMTKSKPYVLAQQEEYRNHIWVNGVESAEKCANIRARILEAAKLKPGYDEKIAVRRQKRKAHKEAQKLKRKQCL